MVGKDYVVKLFFWREEVFNNLSSCKRILKSGYPDESKKLSVLLTLAFVKSMIMIISVPVEQRLAVDPFPTKLYAFTVRYGDSTVHVGH